MLTDGRTDGRRTTDARVTGILIAHLGAFGSGELKNQIKISPNDQPDYPVNSVINLLTSTTLTKCCTAINAAVNNNDNGKIV